MFTGLARLLVVAAALLGLAAPHASQAGEVMERVMSAKLLRVCIWPDYYGVSFRNPRNQLLSGIDIDLSASLAKELDVRLQYVDSSFMSVVQDVMHDRCDIAMFAVGVSAARKAFLSFSEPYLQSDIFAVATQGSRVVRSWADIDKPGIKVAVPAGTFIEPAVRNWLKQAEMVVIKPPKTREQELEAGRVDVFMTDYAYGRRLMDNADWARLMAPPSPFQVLPYAYAVKQHDTQWLQRINQFVTAIKKDGRLKAAAQRAGLAEMVIKP